MGQGQEGSDRRLRGLQRNAKGSRKREGQTMEEREGGNRKQEQETVAETQRSALGPQGVLSFLEVSLSFPVVYRLLKFKPFQGSSILFGSVWCYLPPVSVTPAILVCTSLSASRGAFPLL